MSSSPSSLGPPAPFPTTMWSELVALRGDDPAARRERMEQLIRRYWRPVYWAIRAERTTPVEEARDLAQEFFVRILEGRVVSTADPARGSFRTYLKGALRNFLLQERRNARALKRGGGAPALPLDFASAEPDDSSLAAGADETLDRAWAHEVLAEAVSELGKRMESGDRARIFQAYELAAPGERPSYDDLARRFGTTAREVRTALRAGRRELRKILLEKISQYVLTESDAAAELRELFEA